MIGLQEERDRKSKYGFDEIEILKFLLNDFLDDFCLGATTCPGRYANSQEIRDRVDLKDAEHFDSYLSRLEKDGLIEIRSSNIRITDEALSYVLGNLGEFFETSENKLGKTSPDIKTLVRAFGLPKRPYRKLENISRFCNVKQIS